MASPDDLVSIPLEDGEVLLLRSGVSEWGGPAHCSNELAVAMGFASVADLLVEGQRLWRSLGRREPLSRRDWARVLVATEFAFASVVFGSGSDWPITTALSDDQSIRLLRQVQGKVVPHLGRSAGPWIRESREAERRRQGRAK
jgi:hypothetical protein